MSALDLAVCYASRLRCKCRLRQNYEGQLGVRGHAVVVRDPPFVRREVTDAHEHKDWKLWFSCVEVSYIS